MPRIEIVPTSQWSAWGGCRRDSERIRRYGPWVDRRWIHAEEADPVPGVQDLTLRTPYPDLVVGDHTVLLPDTLVWESDEVVWVHQHATGPISTFDREQARDGPPTPGWTKVWSLPRGV